MTEEDYQRVLGESQTDEAARQLSSIIMQRVHDLAKLPVPFEVKSKAIKRIEAAAHHELTEIIALRNLACSDPILYGETDTE